MEVRLKSGKVRKVNLHSQRLVPIGQMMSILRMVTYRQADSLTFNVFLQDPSETRIYANYLVIQYIWSRCSLREFYQR